MTIALWVVQVMLAAMFAMAGLTKLSQGKEKLKDKMPWVNDFSDGAVRVIGGLEALGAIGLVVPLLVGMGPGLTAWAAVGLVLIMIGAIVTHVRRKESQAIGMNLALLLAAAFVALGRFGIFT